jgi:hypothetical protein
MARARPPGAHAAAQAKFDHVGVLVKLGGRVKNWWQRGFALQIAEKVAARIHDADRTMAERVDSVPCARSQRLLYFRTPAKFSAFTKEPDKVPTLACFLLACNCGAGAHRGPCYALAAFRTRSHRATLTCTFADGKRCRRHCAAGRAHVCGILRRPRKLARDHHGSRCRQTVRRPWQASRFMPPTQL